MAMQTHKGSCHCGAVAYTVEIDLDVPAMTCNCSMCGRTGAILAFVPPEKFHLERGDDNLTDYQFNKQVIHHLFCKTCGMRPFARGQGAKGPMVAINLRCIEGVDHFAQVANAKQFDGASR